MPEKQLVQKVSHSEAETFLSCRRKHYYGYGRGLKPKMQGLSLSSGSFLHEVLEVYYNVLLAAGDTSKLQRAARTQAFETAQAYYEEKVASGEFEDRAPTGRRSVKEALFEFYFLNEPIVSKGWTVLAVELKVALNIELEDGSIFQYPFVVDLIARDHRGKMVVIDHKFLYDFYDELFADLGTQLPKYVGALRLGGYEIDYAAYNMIRNRTKKDAQPEDVMRVLPIMPKAPMINDVLSEQFAVAQEIIDGRSLSIEEREHFAYRSASSITCRSCDFSDLCRDERVGADTKATLMLSFEERDTEKPFEADLIITPGQENE